MNKFWQWLRSLLFGNQVPASHPTVAKVTEAFSKDGFEVVKTVAYQGHVGIMAESRTATNYETGQKKKAYYIEGPPFALGYLMGQLAPKTIEYTAVNFLYNYLPAMFDPNADPNVIKKWSVFLMWVLEVKSEWVRERYPNDVPSLFAQEIEGLEAGCRAVDRRTKVTFSRLWMLAVGFDLIMALSYTGLGLAEWLEEFGGLRGADATDGLNPGELARLLAIPLSCNTFAAYGPATAGGQGHYFGRDFMLATGGVLQDTFAHVIYNPTEAHDGHKPQPFVAVVPPGMTGIVSGMSLNGIGTAVDMLPAVNCDPSRPGFNSSTLLRYINQYATSTAQAVDMITQAQRGCSWLYTVSDAETDRAAAVEAGKTEEHPDYPGYVNHELRHLFPDQGFLDSHPVNTTVQKGAAVRWDDYQYPADYLNFNPGLFEHFGSTYTPEMAAEDGFFDQEFPFKETGPPSKLPTDGYPTNYYMAPQRETHNHLVVATNMAIVPSQRLAMMNALTVAVSKKPNKLRTADGSYSDLQWRYDTLNHLLLQAHGSIDFAKAQELVNFLDPGGHYPWYYNNNPTSKDGTTKMIQGAVTIMDLKQRVIRSHYGYYADEWVTTTLSNYV